MKRCKKFMTFMAVVLVFAMVFSSVSIPASAATTKNITVKNLPSNTLTLSAKKTFTVKTNVAAKKLKFSTSNKKIVTVTSGGKIKAVKKGKANVTISLKSNPKVKKVIKVTVGKPVTKVSLNKANLTIAKGKTSKLTAAVSAKTASNKKVIWSSSNPNVVKVSSKGLITAVNTGSATITAVAADGSGKKASCKVVVNIPVSAITLNAYSGRLAVGAAVTLKATVFPANATNKGYVWSSSNSKVATVNSAGKVVAVSAGSAVITAKATDGSGKSASYNVVVARPVRIASSVVVNPQTLNITLTDPQKLAQTNFAVRGRYMLYGTYNQAFLIDSIATKDNKTYTIKLNKKNRFVDNQGICVYVSGLFGTGTAKTENRYTEGKYNYVYYTTYSYEQGSDIDRLFEIDGYGYSNVTVKNLPAGITWKREEDSFYYIRFKGTFTKTGTTVSTVVSSDELGNTVTDVITWNVYNSSTITANYTPAYYLLYSAASSTSVYKSIDSVSGGSGDYIYSIEGNNYGLSISSSGQITGTLYQKGTYTVRVRVTDANNAKLSVVTNCVINVTNSVTVAGLVKDRSGSTISDAYIRFINRDKASRYNDGDYYSTYTDEMGAYSISLVPGTYDVEVRMENDVTYIYSQTFTTNVSGKDYVSDVKKVMVYTNSSIDPASSFGDWEDADENTYGSGAFVYLAPGTYKLTSEKLWKTATISATVAANTTSVTATVVDNAVPVYNNSHVSAVAGKYYRFTPAATGTYYFYSIGSDDPCGYLYDKDENELTSNDDGGHSLSNNSLEFCMSYNCIAGTTYYIKVAHDNTTLYVSTTNPQSNE